MLTHANKKTSLKRKLFGYMFILAMILLILVMIGMFLIGSFTGTKQRIYEDLILQSEIFERQIDTYYNALAVMGVQLSDNTTDILESYLLKNNIEFDELNNSEEHISALQEALIEELKYKLWEADCTGIFIMLEAQVNSNVQNTQSSKTGIYLQRNSLEEADKRVLLYRGLSQIGKEHDCMPHRKWRLEFDSNYFPNYDEIKSQEVKPANENFRISDVALLPGTDQHVMLMCVSLYGEDNTFYGICGFEINEYYFKQMFAQPSKLSHVLFCLSNDDENTNISQNALSTGVLNEYYLEPKGNFTTSPFGRYLTEFESETESYIGITKKIKLSPAQNESVISILIPKQDYNQMKLKDTLRIVGLIAVFTVSAISLAMFFTKKYLNPIKQSLDKIRSKEYNQDNAYASEICDLFEFLSEQAKINEEALAKAMQEKDDALSTVTQMQNRFDEAEVNLKRLAYSRKDEIDPDDYENFKSGLKSLTDKENEVLNLYISGKTVKDIIEILGLQESTVRFHNKNIYSKLGVHSLKQLLRYTTVFKQEGGIINQTSNKNQDK